MVLLILYPTPHSKLDLSCSSLSWRQRTWSNVYDAYTLPTYACQNLLPSCNKTCHVLNTYFIPIVSSNIQCDMEVVGSMFVLRIGRCQKLSLCSSFLLIWWKCSISCAGSFIFGWYLSCLAESTFWFIWWSGFLLSFDAIGRLSQFLAIFSPVVDLGSTLSSLEMNYELLGFPRLPCLYWKCKPA